VLEPLSVDLADVVEKCRQNAQNLPGDVASRLAQTDADEAARRAEQAHERVLRGSYIPPRFLQVRLDKLVVDDENSAAIRAAFAAVDSGFRDGLGLTGRPGVGKSTVIAAIGAAAIDAGIPARVMRASTLISRLRDARRFGGDEDLADVRRDFERTPVLGLNDLGSEPFDREALVWLHELLDARWENRDDAKGRYYPLFASSNLTLTELARHYMDECARIGENPVRGEAIVDRLRSLTSTPWIALTGRSRR
jgi:DNA replication protein DnaC